MKIYAVFASTNIISLGYDDKRLFLQVDFKSGWRYVYAGVPNAVFMAIYTAPSKGRAIRILENFPRVKTRI